MEMETAKPAGDWGMIGNREWPVICICAFYFYIYISCAYRIARIPKLIIG